MKTYTKRSNQKNRVRISSETQHAITWITVIQAQVHNSDHSIIKAMHLNKKNLCGLVNFLKRQSVPSNIVTLPLLAKALSEVKHQIQIIFHFTHFENSLRYSNPSKNQTNWIKSSSRLHSELNLDFIS